MAAATSSGSPAAPPPPSQGEAESDQAATTRERILDVALDLFARKGYAETSLREIATELGFSKAAIYYHFESKQDILVALHMRMHSLSDHLAPLLAAGDTSTDQWGRLIDVLISVGLENRKLIEVHIRNQEAISEMHREPSATHLKGDRRDLDDQFVDLLMDQSAPIELRVRRMASVGAVGATLLGAGRFTDVPDDVLERSLREVVHRILDDDTKPSAVRRVEPEILRGTRERPVDTVGTQPSS